MKNIVLFVISISLSSLSLTNLCLASDQAREKKHADEILASLVVGEEVWLPNGDQPFLGLFTVAEDTSTDAVILLHGTGVHPNWPDVIFPLREGLPEEGWSSLAIQLPVASLGATFDEYLALFPEVSPRIDAAIAFLHERGYTRIVLIGHSLGAIMGTYYLAQHEQAEIQGFIAIGLSATDLPLVSVPDTLGKTRLPLLDLYGSDDLPTITSTAWTRRLAASDNPNYQQIEADGANHFFHAKDDALRQYVLNWLQTLNPEN